MMNSSSRFRAERWPNRQTEAICMRILIVEDEEKLAGNVARVLQHHLGAAVDIVGAGLANNGQAEIRVHDEGGQIPSDLIDQLTARFLRVDSSPARSTSGTGLSLAIADEIAQRHDGSLMIESSPETGTTVRVRVRLPLYRGA